MVPINVDHSFMLHNSIRASKPSKPWNSWQCHPPIIACPPFMLKPISRHMLHVFPYCRTSCHSKHPISTSHNSKTLLSPSILKHAHAWEFRSNEQSRVESLNKPLNTGKIYIIASYNSKTRTIRGSRPCTLKFTAAVGIRNTILVFLPVPSR